ncbi:RNA polymerase sigma factor RpoD/SigA [Ectobacillus sp. sgz5001026]|uniref:sigma-70 family RNA polymerase sigma factor n=1 Tax=Ectobacillus sp. sgz5001026 TaxID=3242473 RepID=UPI0036D25205
MDEELDLIISPRLKSIDKNSKVNLKWLLNLYKVLSGNDITEEKLIAYLVEQGYFLYSNQISKQVVQEKEEEIKELSLPRKSFNPNDFLSEIDNDDDLNIYSYKDNEYLFRQYNTTGEQRFLDRIVEVNLRLVQSVAKKSLGLGHNLEFDDLVHTGVLGLYKAIEKFDETMDYAFSTYATWWIRQAINREVINTGFMIRLPVHMHEELIKLKKFQNKSIETLCKIDDEWITKKMNITIEKYEELVRIDYNFFSLASLNTIVSEESDSTELIELVNVTQDLEFNYQLYHSENPEKIYLKMATIDIVEELLASLSEREADVIRKRIGLYADQPLTLEEIGVQYNVTRERIRQIESKALNRLRKIISIKQMNKYDLVP